MFYGNNDWRDYLAHSWGTSPKQKAREKEYNHWYWETHKDEIMKRRRERLGQDESDPANDYEVNRNILQDRRWENGENDFKGSKIESAESLDARLQEEIDHIKKMIESNEKAGGYADGDMANIKRHNEMILENLQKLAEQAKSEAGSYSGDQQKDFFSKINDQFDKAHELILDTGKKSTNEYLSSLGVNRTSSGSNSSSGESSKESSSKTAEGSTKKMTAQEQAQNSRETAINSARSSNASGKHANDSRYQSLMDDYRQGRPHNDVHDDLGEFIDEYGGRLDNATINKWVDFRKELGYDTSSDRLNQERQEVKARSQTGTVGTVKGVNGKKTTSTTGSIVDGGTGQTISRQQQYTNSLRPEIQRDEQYHRRQLNKR